LEQEKQVSKDRNNNSALNRIINRVFLIRKNKIDRLSAFHFVAVGITLHFVSGRYVAWIAIRSVLSDWLRYRCATTSHH